MAIILVVDDLAANRAVLVTLLGYQGHRLLEASNGREGLEIARGARPELVITDVLMPVMDGYELVRQLRLDPATRLIPVMFYTAHYGEHEARALALSSGVSHVLTKPVDPEDVLVAVASALAGREQDPPALAADFDRDHLQLLTDKLSRTDEDLRSANARLQALVHIGLELASERDGAQLLHKVCVAARELFGASYVTLGVFERNGGQARHFVASGVDFAEPWTPADLPPLLRSVIDGRRCVRGLNPGGRADALAFGQGHPGIEAYLAGAIASPAHVYGWLLIVSNDGRTFTSEDEHLLSALSGQVGRIYENGYFYRLARHERDRAQRYLDTADVILLARDLDGRLEVINRKGCVLLERDEGELLGADWIEMCVPASQRAEQRQRFRQLVGGDLSVMRSAVVTASGRERLIEWRNTLLRDGDGHVLGTLSSGTDITEEYRALAALRTAEERMRFALESAGVGIWDLDYRTNALQWSETLQSQFGLQPGEFAGSFDDFAERIHPDDKQAVLDSLGGAIKSGADFSVQHRVVRPDGTVRWLSGAGRILLRPDGTPLRGVGISLDVTERRQLEEQYYQAQKMEAIGRLAGGVAHDFNNLLTAILGYCELLLADRPGDDGDSSDIRQIQMAGVRASALTRQLLAFSRKEIIQTVRLDLNAIVKDLQPMLERLIGEDVRVALALRPDIGQVVADRGQLEQVLMNLAVNARDAMPRGGTLTIETANVELDEHYARTHLKATPGLYVALTVSDTGAGMSADVRARLFEPFFTTKEAGKGTGLGLATVHGIVTRYGGSVGVYSELNRGSSFKVYLPHADREAPLADAAPVRPRRQGGGERILVIEDDSALRELTRRLLESQGFSVVAAADAETALRACEADRSIAIVLTDVVMPALSGPEVMAQLASKHPSLRVIYMSGYTEDAITHHGVLKPGIAFINKPFTAEALGRTIREVLDR